VSRAPGLYVHVPFCAHVCPYCDFAVQTGGPLKRQEYVDALLAEIERWGAGESAWSSAAAFDTIYLGGGTPSSLAPEQLAAVVETLNGSLAVAPDVEITLEVNPEDVSAESVAAWRRLGVSRVSLGAQSFDAEALQLLGRSHTPEQAATAVEMSLSAGFDAVSLDLIFAVPARAGAPDQSHERWAATLQRAVDLQPQHISCYELTVHEGTRFFRARSRGDFTETVEDSKAEQFFFTHRFLADAGYPAYEVSNFAPGPGLQSRHNAKYWDHTAYLGVGPSAHSFDGQRRRWWNERRLSDWQRALAGAAPTAQQEETLEPDQLVLEALALGLRTSAGVDLDRIERRWGIALRDANLAAIDRMVDDGLLTREGGARLQPTLEGLAMADTLARSFDISAAAGAPASTT